MKRSSGILLPIFSLPSEHGIGSLGRAAYEFVDFLAEARQRWWQVLPLGQTGFGDSPYQCRSSFAGNPFFIDLDALAADGLLSSDEICAVSWGDDPERVDYDAIIANRLALLRRAFERGFERHSEAVARFAEQNAAWLNDYALFMALKDRFGELQWNEWPDDGARERRPEALGRYERELRGDVDLYIYIQYLFFKQWDSLKAYAASRGVGIIGDMPIYVPLDCADVWARPDLFLLDSAGRPTEVAGVPPDYFSADGQLWGNPLYNFERMRLDGYSWWIARLAGARRLFDAVRIDHFRAFESFWAIPAAEATAKNGRWIKGPGLELINALKAAAPEIEIIAEDLGLLTDEVRALLRASGLPGMKVLEFAFNPYEPSSYLPHNYDAHCVCYTGTHDNAPLALWLKEASEGERECARRYLGLNDGEGARRGIIRGGMSSVAALFIAQMQDWLEDGAEGRINVPGTIGENWRWRMKRGAATRELAREIAAMTELYGRASG